MIGRAAGWAAGIVALLGALSLTLVALTPSVDVPAFDAPAVEAPVLGPVGGLRIPSIGVGTGELVPLGLDAQGQPEVPSEDTPEVAGWYALGPAPGDRGPAVVMGHVNAHHKLGVFAQLAQVELGALVEVDRGREVVRFEVYDVVQAGKDEFPAARVYGRTDGPELRLVTCGGALDRSAGSYEDNIIVFAREVDA